MSNRYLSVPEGTEPLYRLPCTALYFCLICRKYSLDWSIFNIHENALEYIKIHYLQPTFSACYSPSKRNNHGISVERIMPILNIYPNCTIDEAHRMYFDGFVGKIDRVIEKKWKKVKLI